MKNDYIQKSLFTGVEPMMRTLTRPFGTIAAVFAFVLYLLPLSVSAESSRIYLDGQFEDWDDIPPLYEDVIGDQQAGDLDFARLWAANDENYFFLSFEVGVEIILQESNQVRLYLDTDNDPSTGTAVNGIGADLYWTFGDLSGRFYSGISSYVVYQYKIGLVEAPTFSSARYEIALDRSATPVGLTPLFPGDTLKIVLKDLGEGSDMLPNQGEQVTYIFDSTPLPPLEPVSLGRQNPTDLRILTYNVHQDDFFDPSKEHAFTRILSAINPDIIGFQEIYDHNVWDTIELVEMMIGGDWYGEKVNPDIILVSRYPIIQVETIDGNGAFLVDLEEEYDCRMLLVNAHLPAGQNNFDRQMEVDAIMGFIRDAKDGSGAIVLGENSPIMIIGDMNLVGYSSQWQTFITGDIVYQGQNGPPFDPDWDGSTFFDLEPRVTDEPFFYTWIDGPSSYSYSPGRMDYIIFSDYVMAPETRFVLNTATINPDTLAAYGLNADDTDIASDHLPTVGDFWLHLGTAVRSGDLPDIPTEFHLAQNYPNPFNPTTVLSCQLPVASFVNLAVYDITGRKVADPVNGWMDAGTHGITFDGSGLPSGIYIYRLTAGNHTASGKMVLMK
jgi:endonuclease/exonuclease/phosphatase family metal-dependent hydrolase